MTNHKNKWSVVAFTMETQYAASINVLNLEDATQENYLLLFEDANQDRNLIGTNPLQYARGLVADPECLSGAVPEWRFQQEA